ncbi:hypothetical protein ACWYA4_27040 (plasmid) [Klebsiella grimontii]
MTTLIAAYGWIFSREAVAGMPVFAFLGLLFLIAALILLLFAVGMISDSCYASSPPR